MNKTRPFRRASLEGKMELTKIQQEVINRMKILKLHENVVRDYVDDNVINVSERMSAVFDGMLFWAHEDLTKTIRDFEEKYGVIVYHVQKMNTTFGLLYTFLYVNEAEEDNWEEEREELKDGYLYAYVYNADDDLCSEFGSVQVAPKNGGITRLQ